MLKRQEKCQHISCCRVPKVIKNQGESTEALSEERRWLWLVAISRADLTKKILENDWVCGDHFHSEEAAPFGINITQTGFHHLISVMTSSNKVPQRSLTQQLKWKELKRSLREGNISSNDRKKMSSNKKINKPDEPVKHFSTI